MSKFEVGQEVTVERVFSKEDVEKFAALSGDDNPLHVDVEYARASRFGAPVVHGILVAGLVSKAIGTQLPGIGSIYLEQNLRFKRPVYIGDKVQAHVIIEEIDEKKHIYTLRTNVYNQNDECVVAGTAKVLYEG